MSCSAIEGRKLYFSYAGISSHTILDGVNISVERGTIYGLLGPSGCGKTTLLRCIVGLVKPSSGTLMIYGKKPGQKNFSIPGRGVGFMPQELALYLDITIEETLVHFGKLYQMESSEIEKRISFLGDLLDMPHRKKFIKDLSGGQQRRVSFAAALIHRPPVLILDEPTVGVDPLLRNKIWKHLETLAENKLATIIITTHYMEEAKQAHKVGFMRNGRLLTESNPMAMIKQDGVSTLEEVFLRICKNSENLKDPYLQVVKTVHETYKKLHDNHMDFENHCKLDCNLSSVRRDERNSEELEIRSSCMKDCQATAARVAALVTKNVLRIKRNIPLLLSQICLPTVIALICCSAMSGEPFDLPVAVVNMEMEDSGYGNRFLKHVDSHFIRQVPYSNLTLALDSVKQGKTWGALYISPKFSDSLTERFLRGSKLDNETLNSSTIKLHLDFTNKQVSNTVYMKISRGFQIFSKSMLKRLHLNPQLASPPVMLSEPVYSNIESSFTEFIAPSIVGGIIYLSTVGLSGVSIVIEKKQGLLDRLRVAGVQSWEVVFSIFFLLLFIVLAQSAITMVCLLYVFDVPRLGSFIWVAIGLVLIGLEGMSFGLLISAICNDEITAITIIMSSYIPTIVLSGTFWSTEALPVYFRYVSYCMPLTLISNTIRSVLSRGWDITENHIWDGYLVALAWILPVVLLSIFVFKLRNRS